MIAIGLLSACSTAPAPSIYKGGQAAKPAPKPDPAAPVVRPLSSGGLKETPLEVKPLPAKPLNSYVPSPVAPSAPMTPGVDRVQAPTLQPTVQSSVQAGTQLAAQQATQQTGAAVQLANASATNTAAKLDLGAAQAKQQSSQQLAQATSASKQLTQLPLPAASLSGSPAARELAKSADASLSRGDLTASAATLERALRIEPNNAGLWSRLAEVRLRQGDTAQAQQLALKANGLAGADAALRARNEQIVAEAQSRSSVQ
ncbi:MAG: tetratricopeptide repeat protein [Pseudomonadota bacterium]